MSFSAMFNFFISSRYHRFVIFFSGNDLMKDGFFFWLLILLHISIFAHIIYIVAYIEEKKDKIFKGFVVTTATNFMFGMLTLILLIREPDVAVNIEMKTLMLIESGFMFLFLIFVKTKITIRIFRRSKNSDFYDISFFGKKVYKVDIVKKSELAFYFLSMPFTLLTGAYFIANMLF